MSQEARRAVKAFSDTGIGELWKWVIGGLPRHLTRSMAPGDVEAALRQIVQAVEAGASVEDLLQVREDLRGKLTFRSLGSQGPG